MKEKDISRLTKKDIEYLENFINIIDEDNKVFNKTKEIIKEKKKIMFYKEDIKSNKNKD